MPLRKARKGSSKTTRQRVASANIREMHHSSRFASASGLERRKPTGSAIAAGLSAMRGRARRRKKR